MKREVLHRYTGAIVQGVSALMAEATSLAEKTGNTKAFKEIQNIGVIVVSVDEETGMCFVARHNDAKPLALALAAAIDTAVRATPATVEETDANVD